MAELCVINFGKLLLRSRQPNMFRSAFFTVQRPYKTRCISNMLKRAYCTTSLPYEEEDTQVTYRSGYPTINVMLPSRDERCMFTLRPLTDTVGSFLTMVSDEDGGIERISVYRKDGSKIAKATTIDLLLQEDFDLVINSRKFSVMSPKVELSGEVEDTLSNTKDLISQLYTQMHLSEWHASREKELLQTIEAIKHELAPYDQLRIEMMEKAERRTNRMTWLGLTLMGVQFGFLARLTWWEYSWDIMEPVTYFVTYGTSMALFAYYVLSKQEYIFPDVKDRAFLIYLHKLARKGNYDVDHYNSLMMKLSHTESDLKKLRQPLGLSMPQSELKSLLHGEQDK